METQMGSGVRPLVATGRTHAQKAWAPKHALQRTDPANPRAGRASQMDPRRTKVNLCLKPREKWAAKGVDTQPDQRWQRRRSVYCQLIRPPNHMVPGVEQAPKGPVIVRAKELREASTFQQWNREADIRWKRMPPATRGIGSCDPPERELTTCDLIGKRNVGGS